MFRLLEIVSLIISITIQCYTYQSLADQSRDTLKIWALSDIQPRNESHRREFENAVEDINRYITDVDIAIVAGDIVNRTEEEVFDWYSNVKKRSYIDEWYEIAGNHDLKTDLGKLFKEKVNKDSYYIIEKNNARFLFMSDEKRGKSTELSDDTFNWWKQLVEEGQDKIIFVISHAPLKGSGIPFSSMKGRNIIGSNRFRDVLRQYKVDVWLSGHMHFPHSIKNNIVVNSELNNTVFANISSIRPELLGFKDSESFVITLECGSNVILFQSRNHSKNIFTRGLNYSYLISKKYECNK